MWTWCNFKTLQADEAVLPGDAASKLEEAAEISVGFQRLNPKKSKENDEENDPDWDPKPVEKIISPKKTYENQISGSTNNVARKRPSIKLEEPGKMLTRYHLRIFQQLLHHMVR